MNGSENGGAVQDTALHDTYNPALYGGLVLIIIIALAASYWWMRVRPEIPTRESGSTDGERVPESFGSGVGTRAEEPVRKAAESVPNTNPLGEVEVNPYGGYKNPFSR